MSNRRTGRYNEYSRLLNRYKTRHPQEKWSKESYTEESKKSRITKYLHMSEQIMDDMKLVGTQRRDVKWLIKNIPLKDLHRTVRSECIILCLCIYVRYSYEDRFRWQEYGIVKRYNLSCSVLLTVVTNLCIWYSRRLPLPRSDGVDKYGTIIDEEHDF